MFGNTLKAINIIFILGYVGILLYFFNVIDFDVIEIFKISALNFSLWLIMFGLVMSWLFNLTSLNYDKYITRMNICILFSIGTVILAIASNTISTFTSLLLATLSGYMSYYFARKANLRVLESFPLSLYLGWATIASVISLFASTYDHSTLSNVYAITILILVSILIMHLARRFDDWLLLPFFVFGFLGIIIYTTSHIFVEYTIYGLLFAILFSFTLNNLLKAD